MRKLAVLIVLLAGCRGVPMLPGLTPHKIDIQQGNYVTQDMVNKLKPGMSRSQVRFALGTPLIADPFHADRWDYVYVYEHKGRPLAKRPGCDVRIDFTRPDGTMSFRPLCLAKGVRLVIGTTGFTDDQKRAIRAA